MVLTDAGGIKDIVGPIQSNYILPADKPSYFTDLILTLFANPGTLAELSLKLEKTRLLIHQNKLFSSTMIYSAAFLVVNENLTHWCLY